MSRRYHSYLPMFTAIAVIGTATALAEPPVKQELPQVTPAPVDGFDETEFKERTRKLWPRRRLRDASGHQS